MALTIRERAANLFGKKPDETTMVQDKGNVEVTAAVTESKEKLRRRKSSEFRGDGSNPTQEQATAQIANQLSALTIPEVWEPIVRAPASLMMTLTNRKLWDVPEKEIKPLAVTASTAMQYAAIKSPGLLAVSLFLIHATIVYLPRTLQELAIRKQEKIAAAQKQSEAKPKSEP